MEGENQEEYLEAIYGLKEDGREATTNEIAEALGVKAASVTEMLKKLHTEGLIRHRPYYGVELTERGLRTAAGVKRKHRLLERFLYDKLGIRKSEVHRQACALEHGLSDKAADALERLLRFPKRCPDDGKPIPKAGEVLPLRRHLGELKAGDTGKVEAFDGGDEFRGKMRSMGISEGKRIRVVAVEPFGGPVVVKAGNTRVTIGRGMASKIRVVL